MSYPVYVQYSYFLCSKKTKAATEVKVYGFIMKSLNSCQSYRYVVKHVNYEFCKNEPLMPLKTISIFSSVLGPFAGNLYFSFQFHYYLVPHPKTF